MKKTLLTLATLLCSLALAAQTKVVENPETDAVYRLPFDKGVTLVAKSISPLQSGNARSMNLVDYCAWSLETDEYTNVCAPRDGVVESATESSVLILHPDGLYTLIERMETVGVQVGTEVKKGDVLGTPLTYFDGVREVAISAFHLKTNPNYGSNAALNGSYEYLKQYINPIFTTRGKCKVQLTEGGSYTVKARTWCWPWE
ncbi:MAG: M23 family metallopeptidase [Tidjanibacter sp.]|nr:M23 family metallopeptidase [Tidjanibacter sp.]